MSVIIFFSASNWFFCRNDVQEIDFLRKGSYAPPGLEHFPQGFFTGPGLVEMSPDSKRILIIDVYVVVFWFGKYL